jgi:hypothetical protein
VNAARRAELAARSERLAHRTRHWQLPPLDPLGVPALLPEELAALGHYNKPPLLELSAWCAPPPPRQGSHRQCRRNDATELCSC